MRSAQHVQQEAHLAHKAGARGGHLTELANLGARGTRPENCSRDLMQLVRAVLGVAILQLYTALIPLFVMKSLADDGKAQPEMCSVGFILPHIWVWFLYAYHK